MSTSITSSLTELAAQRGEDVFATFLCEGRRDDVTFGRLLQSAKHYAAALSEQGIRGGDVVVVMLQQRPDALYAFLGAMLAGAIPTFMPFPNEKQRHDLFLQDHRALFDALKPAAIITFGALVGLFASEWRVLDSGALPDNLAPFALPQRTSDIACLQHSSGTTALKKGVMLSHEAIAKQVDAYGSSIDFRRSDCIASWLPLYHDMGFVACFLMPLIAGARVVMLDPFEWTLRPRSLFDAIESERATLCWLPNFAFEHLTRTAPPSKAWDLSSIRAIINCSEPCKRVTFERFIARFESSGVRSEQLQVCYAMAENVFAVAQTAPGEDTLARSKRDDSAWLSCGKSIAGVSVQIRDDRGQELPNGQTGEIFISSPFLFEGYYGKPDTGCIAEGWYRTGDLGFRCGSQLYVTGRVDDILVLNGRKYYAHSIEEIVTGTPGVLPGRCLACLAEDAQTGTAGLAILAETDAAADGHDALRQRIRTRLFERAGLGVAAIELLSPRTLIKSTSGKLNRKRNVQLYHSGALGKQIEDEYDHGEHRAKS